MFLVCARVLQAVLSPVSGSLWPRAERTAHCWMEEGHGSADHRNMSLLWKLLTQLRACPHLH